MDSSMCSGSFSWQGVSPVIGRRPSRCQPVDQGPREGLSGLVRQLWLTRSTSCGPGGLKGLVSPGLVCREVGKQVLRRSQIHFPALGGEGRAFPIPTRVSIYSARGAGLVGGVAEIRSVMFSAGATRVIQRRTEAGKVVPALAFHAANWFSLALDGIERLLAYGESVD